MNSFANEKNNFVLQISTLTQYVKIYKTHVHLNIVGLIVGPVASFPCIESGNTLGDFSINFHFDKQTII